MFLNNATNSVYVSPSTTAAGNALSQIDLGPRITAATTTGAARSNPDLTGVCVTMSPGMGALS